MKTATIPKITRLTDLQNELEDLLRAVDPVQCPSSTASLHTLQHEIEELNSRLPRGEGRSR